MEKESIFKIFEEVAKEASMGKIDAFFTYRILFETMINGEKIYKKPKELEDKVSPVLKINNLEEFKNVLAEYVKVAKEFYKNDMAFNYFDNERIVVKKIITNIWSNASFEDFINPIKFIEKRIDFMHNKINDVEQEIPFLKSNIKIKSVLKNLSMETPYSLTASLTDGTNEYVLPEVYYGISNGIAYIYGIQSRSRNDNVYAKKIKRLIYHVNEGFNEDIVNDENLKDITPSFVLMANILFGLLKRDGIYNIEVVSLLPIRYNSKLILSEDKELPEFKKDIYNEENINYMQSNMTDKFIRTFRRLAYHHTGLEITSYPMDIDSSMHMTIMDNDICLNELLNETSSFPNDTPKR